MSSSSITLKNGNFLAHLTGSNVLGKQDLNRAAKPDELDKTATTWDKIQDWFCGTNRVEIKQKVRDLYDEKTPVFEKRRLFKEIKEASGVNDQKNFKAEYTSNGRLVHKLLDIDDDIFSIDMSPWGNKWEDALPDLEKLYAKETPKLEQIGILDRLSGIAKSLGNEDLIRQFHASLQPNGDERYSLSLCTEQGGKFILKFVNNKHDNTEQLRKELNAGEPLHESKLADIGIHTPMDTETVPDTFREFVEKSSKIWVADRLIDDKGDMTPDSKVDAVVAALKGMNLRSDTKEAFYRICSSRTVQTCKTIMDEKGIRSPFSNSLYIPFNRKRVIQCHIYKDPSNNNQLTIELLSSQDMNNTSLNKEERDRANYLITTPQPKRGHPGYVPANFIRLKVAIDDAGRLEAQQDKISILDYRYLTIPYYHDI